MARGTSGIYRRGKTWWITYIGSDGKQVWESSGSKLKADADYKLSCRKKDIAEGLVPVTSNRKKFNTTIDDLAVKYLEFCKPQRDFKTKSCRVETLKRYFGPTKLTAITLEDLEKYQSQRQTEPRSPKKEGAAPLPPVKAVSVNREIATLKHMFTKADQWGLIPAASLNMIRKVKLSKVNNSRLRFLSIEESRNLVKACGRSLREIVTFALNTGCRRGEIFVLKWEHVDLKHGFVRIADSKNGESRDFPVNTILADMLKNISVRRESPFVFVNPETGTRYHALDKGSREVAACAINTGCSKSDLYSLTWEHVDLKRGLTVRG